METVLKFYNGKQKVYLTPNEEVTDHSDIDIIVENVEKHGDEVEETSTFLYLREHEAIFLAKEILRFVEMNRKDNVRWNEDEEKGKNR